MILIKRSFMLSIGSVENKDRIKVDKKEISDLADVGFNCEMRINHEEVVLKRRGYCEH